ncbi:phage antirepressor KilAC domain-containing protein [Bacteroides salyersiae]|nr:phage antirepressor KilAC domain-containing protein [Bacteroides salyersiae]
MEIQEYDQDKQRWVLNQSFVGLGYTYTVVYEPVDPYEEPREYMVWTPKGKDYIWEQLIIEKKRRLENKRKENSL